jgi:hypothetical protein
LYKNVYCDFIFKKINIVFLTLAKFLIFNVYPGYGSAFIWKAGSGFAFTYKAGSGADPKHWLAKDSIDTSPELAESPDQAAKINWSTSLQ